MKHILFFLFLFSFVGATAQTTEKTTAAAGAATVRMQPSETPVKQGFSFGVFSYDAAIKSMPEYITAQRQLTDLKNKYDAEAKRAEEEFNSKYEDFLEGQKDFPPTILQKRQSELQEMMTKNVAFRTESQKLLENAEKEIMAPLHQKLAGVLKVIGEKEGFSLIVNSDNHACPFVNPAQGRDINQLVKDCLK